MTTCTINHEYGVTRVVIAGRIDSMSSAEIQNQLDELILGGSRLLVVDVEQVNFISSAGLRIFLHAQKQLERVDGQIIIYKVQEGVLRVFRMSGFDRIIQLADSEAALALACSPSQAAAGVIVTSTEGITFTHRLFAGVEPGTLRIIGSQEKLLSAGYDEQDVISIPQSQLHFGAGLATVGERYEEYKNLFGETLIINKNIFYYPAVKRPAVDYMFYTGEDVGTECKFFHGFAFAGSYSVLASFETTEAFITLDQLVEWMRVLPLRSPLAGIVLLAESRGLYGMNLKQIPVREHKPANGGEIFDAGQVGEWINYPIDPCDQNHIVAATGLVCRDKAACTEAVQKLFSGGSPLHLHAGVFEKGPLSKNIEQFSEEVQRILTELEIKKVQHMLGQSRFSNGMIGIIELKG